MSTKTHLHFFDYRGIFPRDNCRYFDTQKLFSLSDYNVSPRSFPWRRKWQSTSVFLPRESHGERSLAGYSPWAGKESDKTEQLSFILTQGISMDIF